MSQTQEVNREEENMRPPPLRYASPKNTQYALSRNSTEKKRKFVHEGNGLLHARAHHASLGQTLTPLYSITASAQLRRPPSSFSTRVISSSASRTRISNGASSWFTGCLRRGRKIIPPSLGP